MPAYSAIVQENKRSYQVDYRQWHTYYYSNNGHQVAVGGCFHIGLTNGAEYLLCLLSIGHRALSIFQIQFNIINKVNTTTTADFLKHLSIRP